MHDFVEKLLGDGFQLLPTLREQWLRPLMTAFGQILLEHQVTREIFSVL